MGRSIAILIAILIGICVPAAERFTFIIRYNLMVMLFFAFLEVRLSLKLLHRDHLRIAGVNLVLPPLLYYLLSPFAPEAALAVFVIASAPTAAAAPVMASFLQSEVGFVTTAVLLTSPLVAVLLPITTSAVLGSAATFSFWDIALPVFSLLFIPLTLALLLRWSAGRVARKLRAFSHWSFRLFLVNVVIAAAAAAGYFQSQPADRWLSIAGVGLAIGLLCIAQFKAGEWLGKAHLPLETGLALGRKNTMFSLWFALAFFNPSAALGPIFYILAQNIYNSWQLYHRTEPVSPPPAQSPD